MVDPGVEGEPFDSPAFPSVRKSKYRVNSSAGRHADFRPDVEGVRRGRVWGDQLGYSCSLRNGGLGGDQMQSHAELEWWKMQVGMEMEDCSAQQKKQACRNNCDSGSGCVTQVLMPEALCVMHPQLSLVIMARRKLLITRESGSGIGPWKESKKYAEIRGDFPKHTSHTS